MNKNAYAENLDDPSLTEREKIDHIVEKIEKWYSYFSFNNDHGSEMKAFLMGAQWSDSEVSYYRDHNKHPLVLNKLYAIEKQLIGEEIQNSPNLKLTPVNYSVDDTSVSKKVKLHEDIVQSIEYNSRTNVEYKTTYKNQLEFGYGALFVYPDYRSENSFDQEIKILAAQEPQSYYWDPAARNMDKSDGEYCGIVSFMSKDEFKKKYPKIDMSEIQNIVLHGKDDMWFKWIEEDNICISDHYQKMWKKKTICRLSDGSTVDKDELDSVLRKKRESLRILEQIELMAQTEGRTVNLTRGIEKIEVVDERESTYCKIKHFRIVRNHILEENEIAGKYLPSVFVDGDSHYIEGRQYTKTFIDFAQDAQKFLNYCATETMSYIRGGRKEKFLTTKTHLQGNEKAWRGLDNDNLSLPYNPDPMAPPPAPIPTLDIPQTLLQQYNRAENDLHTILGRYEAGVGAPSREISGRAVDSRIRQGNITSLDAPDNLRLAQEQVGRIILDLIPTVYDTYRTFTIENEMEGKRTIEINKQIGKDEYENKIENDEFELAIVAGSSFAAQKADNFNQLMDLIARIPAFGQVVPDLAAENLNVSNAPKIVERARNYLIPQIAMQERGEPLPPPKPDPQQQMMVSMAQSEQKKADASLLSAQAKMMKAESDVRKDFSDNETRKIEAAAEIGKANLEYDTQVLKNQSERAKAIKSVFE